MADAQIDTSKPGHATLEGRIAIAGTILGILGTIAPALLEMFTSLKDAYPQSAALATAASIAGMIVTALVATGYGKQRTALKVAAVNAGADASSPPRGFARPWMLVGLAVLCVLGCAALSHVSGSTGRVDLGKGYTCDVTLLDTDHTACVKETRTVCNGPGGFHNETITRAPVPRAADGSCP